jgi:alpha/beta superfamily hydrolase
MADAARREATARDWADFPLLPAGTVLAGVGAALLWRTRRAGGHAVLRRAAIGIGALLSLSVIGSGILAAVYATHRPRDPVSPVDFGSPAAAITLRTADGIRLAAHYVPSRNGAAVILYPRAADAEPHARMLTRHGFGVLALDARGYGGSAGDPNAFGWGGARDLDAAVAYLLTRADVLPGGIGGLGLSVGGEQMIDAAAENRALAAVVSDGAGERSVNETLLRGARAAPAIVQQAIQTAALAALSGRTPPLALTTTIGRITPRAVLLIEAEHGAGGEDLNQEYFSRAGRPKALWRAAGATHTSAIRTAPRSYERRVVGFLLAHLRHRPGARPSRPVTAP